MIRKAVILLLLSCFFAISAQELGENRDRFFEMAKRYEVKAQDPPPKWSIRKNPPLFRIVWISDMHITDQSVLEYHRRIFRQIRYEVRPQAVLITGDSWGIGADGPARQRGLKAFLDESLGKDVPAIVLPGDNWPQGFETVFGPSKFAFTLGGFRFICASVDAAGQNNGCSIYTPQTLEWLKAQFSQAGGHPVVFVQHEPVEPPTTLEAPQIGAMLDQTPQAFLALGGHLHLNLEFRHGHWRQWVGPSTGRSHCPAFKVLSFYPEWVMSQDWEESPDGAFRPVNKFLRAGIPREYRKDLCPVEACRLEEYQFLPATPIRFAPELDGRSQELTQRLMQFALQFALKEGR